LKGELLKEVSKNGSYTIYSYDSLSRPTQCVVYDPQGRALQTTTKKYNALHLLSETDAAGIPTTYTYDAAGRLTQKERAGARICYFYDTLSREVEVHEHFGLGASEYLVKAKKYDLLNRIIEETELDSSGVTQNCVEYGYDEAGNRTVVKTFNQAGESCHTTRYNVLNEPVGLVDALQNTSTISHQYSYRHRLGMKVPYSETTDPLNRKILHIHDAHHRLSQVQKVSASGNLIQMREQSYDLKGNLIKTVESVIGRNAAPVSTTYSYDAMNRLIATMEAAGTAEQKLTQHVYAPSGQLVKLLKADGNSLHYEYDPLERLTALTSSNQDLSYCLSDECHYTYDENDQLTSETGMLQQGFVNDSLYNQVTKDEISQKFNALHQLLQEAETVYDYDRNGNRISKKQGDQTIAYEYDSLDRLTRVQTDTESVQYIYDYDNRRLYKKFFFWDGAQDTWIEQESHRYLYVGNNEVGTVDSTGKIIELRILGLTQGAEVGAAIAHEKEEQLYVPEHDHQGHVVMLLGLETGVPLETYRYSAFGSEQLYDANGNQLQIPRSPWRFASKRLDPESGFVYFGERYYDSASLRWITPDPLGFADGPIRMLMSRITL